MTYDDYAALLNATTADVDVDPGFAYGDALEPWDVDQLLTQARNAERQRIDAELAEIDTQLHARDALHEDLVHELERDRKQYEERLDQLIRQFASQDRQARPKARIREFTQQLRQEHRQHWRDRQDLLAERRDLRRELAELTDEVVPQFR